MISFNRNPSHERSFDSPKWLSLASVGRNEPRLATPSTPLFRVLWRRWSFWASSARALKAPPRGGRLLEQGMML
jgi:hypothetical protein